MPLTPADVHNVAFSKPPIGKRGYNEDEVDAFLDLVEVELSRLIEENNDLRAQVEQLDAQLESARADIESASHSVPQAAQRMDEPRRLTPVPPPSAMEQTSPGGAGGDHHVQAAKVLGLAQEMADRLTGEAKAESDGMLAEARTKSEQLLSEARAKSDTMVNDARTRAETLERQSRDKATTLERDAQRQHSEVLGQVQAERSALEKKIDELRTFEREYRTRLKTFLESSLRELGDRGSAAPSTGSGSAEGSRSSGQQGYAFGPRAAEAG